MRINHRNHREHEENSLPLINTMSCKGCRSLQGKEGFSCGIIGFECTKEGVPTGPCPRPYNYKEWIDAENGFIKEL